MSATGSLARARCELHPEREAAVRCPACRRDYCRECVVEHGGRLLCARCLARATAREAGRGRHRTLAAVGTATGIAAGLLVAWLCIYLYGRALALLPGLAAEPAAESSP
jgi:hypothetical protein